MLNHACKNILVWTLLSLNVLLVNAQKEYIVTVNPTNAAITKISSIPGVMYLVSTTAFDQTTKQYTFMGKLDGPTSLYTVDAISGSIRSNPIIPAPNNLVSIQYSRSTGILYGIVRESGIYSFVSIDKITSSYSLINHIMGFDIYDGFTIDELNQHLFVKAYSASNTVLLTIDLATGNIISQAVLAPQTIQGLRYDNSSHKIYAIANRPSLNPVITIFSICTVDPVSGIISNIADLPVVSGIHSDEFYAFNENDHVYYLVGVDALTPATHLYSINVNTGVIIAEVPIPSSGDINNDNLVFFRYDNISGKLYALLWEAQTTLPITLNRFDAVPDEKSVLCKWQTLQEINSNHFAIERSYDAENFSVAGNVIAAGNSSLPHNYNFIDLNPFSVGHGYLYYRLKMIDNDANFTYSNTVKVKLKYSLSLNIFPIPVSDHLFVNLISLINENTIISIIDPAGKKIYSQKETIKKGNNTFQINTSFMAAGEYILYISGENNYSNMFIKIR